jgi:hypothetical protein
MYRFLPLQVNLLAHFGTYDRRRLARIFHTTSRVLSQQRSVAGFGSAPRTHASRLLIYEASVAGLKRAENAIERSKRDFF